MTPSSTEAAPTCPPNRHQQQLHMVSIDHFLTKQERAKKKPFTRATSYNTYLNKERQKNDKTFKNKIKRAKAPARRKRKKKKKRNTGRHANPEEQTYCSCIPRPTRSKAPTNFSTCAKITAKKNDLNDGDEDIDSLHS